MGILLEVWKEDNNFYRRCNDKQMDKGITMEENNELINGYQLALLHYELIGLKGCLDVIKSFDSTSYFEEGYKAGYRANIENLGVC